MLEPLLSFAVRAAIVAVSFFAAAATTLGVGAAFHAASAQPWLRDTPAAREAVAACPARAGRDARRECVRVLVARAQARDAGAARLAAADRAAGRP